jgi:hypothetical protein
MKTMYLSTMIAGFLLLSAYGSINGQVKINAFAINPKIGAYSWIGDNVGLVRGGEINILLNKSLFSLDYYHCMEIMAIPRYNQINFLAGKEIAGKYLRFQFQGGIGTFWGVKRGQWIQDNWYGYYESDKFFTVGIPLKLGIKTITKGFIGVDFQGNLNFEKPLYMTLFSIELGKFRSTKKRQQDNENRKDFN